MRPAFRGLAISWIATFLTLGSACAQADPVTDGPSPAEAVSEKLPQVRGFSMQLKDPSGAVTSRILQPSSNEAVLTAGIDYSQALTSTTTLSNKFLMESGSSDTLFTDALALTIKMSTKLALSLGYSLQDNTKPPAGLKKLDTLETVNLVFGF